MSKVIDQKQEVAAHQKVAEVLRALAESASHFEKIVKAKAHADTSPRRISRLSRLGRQAFRI